MENLEVVTDVLDRAIIFATKAHSGSFRKRTKIPYIVHPMEVAAIVASMTDDKEIIAAAVLHDTVEDTEATIEDIRREFGERVAKMVSAESENKREDRPSEETWKIRKQETIDHLRDKASIEEKMIALGDKLSNIRAIHRDYLAIGDKLWDRFNQSNPKEILWYYQSVGDALIDLKDTVAFEEYRSLVNTVFDNISARQYDTSIN